MILNLVIYNSNWRGILELEPKLGIHSYLDFNFHKNYE